jgi:hypothetical protein
MVPAMCSSLASSIDNQQRREQLDFIVFVYISYAMSVKVTGWLMLDRGVVHRFQVFPKTFPYLLPLFPNSSKVSSQLFADVSRTSTVRMRSSDLAACARVLGAQELISKRGFVELYAKK